MIVGIQGIHKNNMLNVVRSGKVYIHLGVGFGIWDAGVFEFTRATSPELSNIQYPTKRATPHVSGSSWPRTFQRYRVFPFPSKSGCAGIDCYTHCLHVCSYVFHYSKSDS